MICELPNPADIFNLLPLSLTSASLCHFQNRPNSLHYAFFISCLCLSRCGLGCVITVEVHRRRRLSPAERGRGEEDTHLHEEEERKGNRKAEKTACSPRLASVCTFQLSHNSCSVHLLHWAGSTSHVSGQLPRLNWSDADSQSTATFQPSTVRTPSQHVTICFHQSFPSSHPPVSFFSSPHPPSLPPSCHTDSIPSSFDATQCHHTVTLDSGCQPTAWCELRETLSCRPGDVFGASGWWRSNVWLQQNNNATFHHSRT